jgi:hypothetical protein
MHLIPAVALTILIAHPSRRAVSIRELPGAIDRLSAANL